MSKLLDDGHWNFEEFRQTVSKKEAQEILKDRFHIIYGRLREFTARPLGVGMYEISKKPLY